MRSPSKVAVILALALGACGTLPPPASLPADAAWNLADPTQTAILNTAYVFAAPARLARDPAGAALAIAQAEHVAVALRHDQRFIDFVPTPQLLFEIARPEWRAALGIADAAPPQSVIDALFSARRALQANDLAAAAASLHAPVFTEGGDAVLTRLANLPSLPRTAAAAAAAASELQRPRGGNRRSWRSACRALPAGAGPC